MHALYHSRIHARAVSDGVCTSPIWPEASLRYIRNTFFVIHGADHSIPGRRFRLQRPNRRLFPTRHSISHVRPCAFTHVSCNNRPANRQSPLYIHLPPRSKTQPRQPLEQSPLPTKPLPRPPRIPDPNQQPKNAQHTKQNPRRPIPLA